MLPKQLIWPINTENKMSKKSENAKMSKIICKWCLTKNHIFSAHTIMYARRIFSPIFDWSLIEVWLKSFWSLTNSIKTKKAKKFHKKTCSAALLSDFSWITKIPQLEQKCSLYMLIILYSKISPNVTETANSTKKSLFKRTSEISDAYWIILLKNCYASTESII